MNSNHSMDQHSFDGSGGLQLTVLFVAAIFSHITLSDIAAIITMIGGAVYIFNQVITARKNWRNRNN